MEHERETTPALEEARRRRADLRDALYQVEQRISGPAVGRTAAWAEAVLKSLEVLRVNFEEHILVTERPGGLYEEIMGLAPRLAGKIQALREEHPVILAAIQDMTRRLETEDLDGEWPVDEARDDLQLLLGKIVRHRQHGADLVWEAYNLDIGGRG